MGFCAPIHPLSISQLGLLEATSQHQPNQENLSHDSQTVRQFSIVSQQRIHLHAASSACPSQSSPSMSTLSSPNLTVSPLPALSKQTPRFHLNHQFVPPQPTNDIDRAESLGNGGTPRVGRHSPARPRTDGTSWTAAAIFGFCCGSPPVPEDSPLGTWPVMTCRTPC